MQTNLGQFMLAGKSGALLSLHEVASVMAVLVIGSENAGGASRLLYDDAGDDVFFNVNLGNLEDGIVDAADVLAVITHLEHLQTSLLHRASLAPKTWRK